MAQLESTNETNSWRCLACDRMLGLKSDLAFSVQTQNKQVVIFVPDTVIGRCKCGIVTVVRHNKISFMAESEGIVDKVFDFINK